MKKSEPRTYPGTFDPDLIPDRARFRDALGHTYTRRGGVAIGRVRDVEYRTPLASLWRPLEVIAR